MGVGVRLHTDLQQREQAVWTSKIRYQIKEFSIGYMGRFKPLGSLNSLLSYVPQLSGPNPVSLFTLSSGSCGRWLPLEFPQLLSNHHGGWITMAGGGICWIELWEPAFTFGGQKSLMAVTFSVYWYGRRYFHFAVSFSLLKPNLKQSIILKTCTFKRKNYLKVKRYL